MPIGYHRDVSTASRTNVHTERHRELSVQLPLAQVSMQSTPPRSSVMSRRRWSTDALGSGDQIEPARRQLHFAAAFPGKHRHHLLGEDLHLLFDLLGVKA